MDGRFTLRVILTFAQMIKAAAQIAQGTFRSVLFIDHLHFQIDERIVVQNDFDIQYELFGIVGIPGKDGVGDLN